MKLPTCPEICRSCQTEDHVFHVEDELSSLFVISADHGKHFLLRGYGELDPERDTLKRLIKLAANEITKGEERDRH